MLGDGSMGIYCDLSAGVGALYFGLYGDSPAAYFQKINSLDSWKGDGLWLFPAVRVAYTSWPFGKWDAVETVKSVPYSSAEYIMNMGGYKLYIKDGKKWINL